MTDQNMNEVSFEIELLDKQKNMEPIPIEWFFIGSRYRKWVLLGVWLAAGG
jgi:hypothetical protein